MAVDNLTEYWIVVGVGPIDMEWHNPCAFGLFINDRNAAEKFAKQLSARYTEWEFDAIILTPAGDGYTRSF